MKIVNTIRAEIGNYIDREQEISEGVMFSQHKLVKRLGIYKNRHYPKGKIDPRDGTYKYWFDITQPRVNNEIKNLRFSSKNILPFSNNPVKDFAAVFTLHAALTEWMWESNREDELTDSIEQFSDDGNWLARKVKGGYETCDPVNTYIINQAAKTVEDTTIILRSEMTQSQLRAKTDWQNVDEVIKECGNKFFRKTLHSGGTTTTMPMYEIFERDGEVSEAELFEAQGKEGGEENKYVLARIVGAISSKETDKRYILFAEELPGTMTDWFAEAHRGPYKGRWWREGLRELLLDHQYRANEIGIQIARGLDWASKVIFKDDEPQLIQNIRTDLANGGIIKSKNLAQVEVRLQGLDQLIADWNRLMLDADRIANSAEVVTGESLPANTPLGLGQLLDENANKLFVHLRAKLGHAYARVFKDFVLPQLVKDIKGKDIIHVTGDVDFIDRFQQLAVDAWYVQNLVKIGPHTQEMADQLKQAKLKELAQTEPLLENDLTDVWAGLLKRIQITITGENYDVSENLQTIAAMLPFEQDPVRRAFLMDTVYSAKGIPVPPPVQPGLLAPSPGADGSGKPTNSQIKSIAKTGAAQPAGQLA